MMLRKFGTYLWSGTPLKQLISKRVVCSKNGFQNGATKRGIKCVDNVRCSRRLYNTRSSEQSPLKVRYVYVNTSRERWAEFPQGLLFDVAYLDSHPGSEYNSNIPLIVALHDSPGSHDQLNVILEPLSKLGYRVIVPNFPGFGLTAGAASSHDDIFLHSTDERAQFVTDFLSELGIRKVDVLIGYRSGCYPGVRLCSEDQSLFQSIVLICPSGHRPYRGIQPVSLYMQLSELWDRPFLRPFMKLFLHIMRYRNPVFRNEPFEHMIPILHTVTNTGFEEFGGFLVSLSGRAFPCCMMYSKNDPQIQPEVFEEYADLLGISVSDFMLIDHENKIVKSVGVAEIQKGVIFSDGGKDPLEKQSGHIVKIIWDFVKFVRRKS